MPEKKEEIIHSRIIIFTQKLPKNAFKKKDNFLILAVLGARSKSSPINYLPFFSTCSTLGNLKKHKSIVHEGLKIHQCHFCSKVFAQSFDMKRHIITVHEGAKNYKCDHCNQRFSQAGNLKQHLNR